MSVEQVSASSSNFAWCMLTINWAFGCLEHCNIILAHCQLKLKRLAHYQLEIHPFGALLAANLHNRHIVIGKHTTVAWYQLMTVIFVYMLNSSDLCCFDRLLTCFIWVSRENPQNFWLTAMYDWLVCLAVTVVCLSSLLFVFHLESTYGESHQCLQMLCWILAMSLSVFHSIS